MSCGNRFQCGIGRFQKHSFTPDKPSNQALHNETQQKLNSLLKAREYIDTQFFSSNIKIIETPTILPTNSISYTPWTIPSTQDFQAKLK